MTVEVEWGFQRPDGTVTLTLIESAARRRAGPDDLLVRRIVLYSDWEQA